MSHPPVSAARRRTLLAGLFLLALILRLAYLAQMSESPFWNAPILDEEVNHRWAASVAAGEGWGDLPFFRAPLYPWTLGAMYSVLGAHPGGARVAQAVLSAASCLLAWWLGRRAFGPAAGWCAGVLAALYWPWIYFDGELQDVPLTLFLNLAALALLVGWEPGRRRRWLVPLAGLLLGLSAITRPTVLVAAAAVGAWLLWPRRGTVEGLRRAMGQRVPAALLLAAGVAVPVLAVTGMNRVGGGDWVLVASQGGINFYLGNHPGADGRSARLPGAPADWDSLVAESVRRAEADRGRDLRPSEVSRYWYDRGLDSWRRYPVEALRLALHKAGTLASSPEIPNNKQIRFVLERYAPILGLPWPGFGLVAPLGLVGLLWGAGGRRQALLAAFALSYGVAVAAFFVTARFRMPVAAVWIVLAGGGAAALWRLARQRRPGRLAVALAVLAAAGLAVNLPARVHRENLAHGHYSLAQAHRKAGETARAKEEYRLAAASDPRLVEAALGLSTLLLEEGRSREAVAVLQGAVAANPDDVRGRANLALALEAAGRPAEAVRVLQQGIVRAPRDPELWLRLGNAQAAAELPGRAVDSYRRTLKLDPGHGGAWSRLGIALSDLGDRAGAVEAFSRAAELEPANPRAHLNLGQSLALAGQVEEAAAELRRARQLSKSGSGVRRLAEEALRRLTGSSPSG